MFELNAPKSIVLFLVLLTFLLVLFLVIREIIAGEKRFKKLSKGIKERESIRNIIRLLVLEAGAALLILYVSLRYGEGERFLGLIALFSVAVFCIFVAIGLWRFRENKWVRYVATVLAILILFPLSLVVQITFPAIILGLYDIGVFFVVTCVIVGIIAWIIGAIKGAGRKSL